jgi:acylphosphatase
MAATNANTQAFYARVKGRVQGVGFRWQAINAAQRLRLRGWVRNASNGDVEVWAEGDADSLDAFEQWLRRGPQFARVEGVDREEKAPRGYRDFGVEY